MRARQDSGNDTSRLFPSSDPPQGYACFAIFRRVAEGS